MPSSTRSVVITGSSSGIGLEITRAFLEQGANVALNGRDPREPGAVLYLTDAKFVTGHMLRVDGGFVTGRP